MRIDERIAWLEREAAADPESSAVTRLAREWERSGADTDAARRYQARRLCGALKALGGSLEGIRGIVLRGSNPPPAETDGCPSDTLDREYLRDMAERTNALAPYHPPIRASNFHVVGALCNFRVSSCHGMPALSAEITGVSFQGLQKVFQALNTSAEIFYQRRQFAGLELITNGHGSILGGWTRSATQSFQFKEVEL